MFHHHQKIILSQFQQYKQYTQYGFCRRKFVLSEFTSFSSDVTFIDGFHLNMFTSQLILKLKRLVTACVRYQVQSSCSLCFLMISAPVLIGRSIHWVVPYCLHWNASPSRFYLEMIDKQFEIYETSFTFCRQPVNKLLIGPLLIHT